MASRYDTQSTNLPQYSGTFTNTAGQSSSQSSTSSSSSESASSQSTTKYNIDTMSGAGRQALNQLLAQLAAGGTEEQRANKKLLLDQINNLEALSQDYSKANAFADAQGLMAQVLRQGMESAMPTILQSQAAAGTSGDALSALLAQDAATRSSEAASAQGLAAAVDYGQILASLQGQKTNLAGSMEDTVTNALLDALNIDKGSRKTGTETTKGSSSASRTSSSTTTESKQTTGKGSEFKAVDNIPQSVIDFQKMVG